MIKHDMLPGLRARAFHHRLVVGLREKLCPFVSDSGQICQEEETLEHFFFRNPLNALAMRGIFLTLFIRL